jgi:hypothetical protein
LLELRGTCERARIFGSALGDGIHGDIDDRASPVAGPHSPVGGHLTDLREVELPLPKDVLHLSFPPALDDEEHPLLGLREEHLVGGHPLLA